MSRSTLAAAHAELVGLLRDGSTPLVDGVTAVFDYEPALREGMPPRFITVCTVGMDADYWEFAVRVYLTLNPDPVTAQTDLDTMLPAVDALLQGQDGGTGFGPSAWTVDVNVEVMAVIATCVLSCGRQDYY